MADPTTRLGVLDVLHAHILDLFNEHGVQIMTPAYEGDPASPKIVPKDQWFAPREALGTGPVAGLLTTDIEVHT